MALTPQDIKQLAKELEKVNITTAQRLEDEQATRDVLKDQVKQLKFQDSLKQDINKATDAVYKIQTNLRYEEEKALGTRQATLAIQKQLEVVNRSINTLELNRNILEKEGGRLNTDIANSIGEQLEKAQNLQKELEAQQKTSKEINNNFGTGGFQFLSELTSKLGGKASQLSQPFEKMAEASRAAVESGVKQNKDVAEQKQIIQDIIDGKRKATKAELKGMKILNKEQIELYGPRGRAYVKKHGMEVVKGMGKSASKTKLMGQGLKAGFNSMSGMASKANVYLLIAMAIVKVVKFIVDLFIKANEQNVMISRNLGVSRDTAIQLREEFTDIAAKTKNTFVNNKELLKVYNAQVEVLGQMGGINKENLANAVFLEKNMGLTAEDATKLTKNFSLFGEDAKQTTSDIIDAKNEFNVMTGIGITNKRLFQEIGGASKTIAYFNGNSTEELAKSALEAFKLGTNLKQAEQISTGLLDFETSIAKELEAEVLLGKDLNFEKARGLALAGDDVAAAKEVLTQTNKLLKGRKLNRIELNAIADATGLSTDELLMQQKLMTLNDKLTKNQRAELEKIIDKEKERGKELSTQERIELAREAAMGMTYEQLEKNKTLQESYNAAIEKLQETLVGLVEGGIVDTLVEAIESFAEFIEVFVAGNKEDKSKEQAKEIKKREDLTGEEKKYIEELEKASQDQKGFFEAYGESLLRYNIFKQAVVTPLDFLTDGKVGGAIDAYFDADNKRAEDAEAELKRISAGGAVFGDPETRLKSEQEIRIDLYMDSTKVASVAQSGTNQ